MTMKFLVVTLTLCLALATVTKSAQAAAAAVCGETDKDGLETSDVNVFFKKVQCTFERARPWVENIEEETKKLQESAKKFGSEFLNKMGELVEKWLVGDNSTSSNALPEDLGDGNTIDDAPVELNEVEDAAPEKCANGQVPDVEGRCQHVV